MAGVPEGTPVYLQNAPPLAPTQEEAQAPGCKSGRTTALMKKRRVYYFVCQGLLFLYVLGWVGVQLISPIQKGGFKGNFTYIG